MFYYIHWDGPTVFCVLFSLFLWFCVRRRGNFIFSLSFALLCLAYFLSKGERSIFALLYPFLIYLSLRHFKGFMYFIKTPPKALLGLFVLSCFCCAFAWANDHYIDAFNSQMKFEAALWSVLILWAFLKYTSKILERDFNLDKKPTF